MNKAVYGKTMENLRNRIDVRLVSNEKDYLKWTSKRSYLSQKIFHNNLVAICKSKVTVRLTIWHICILDLCKTLMYEFHYDFIKINIVTTKDYYSLKHTV